MQKQKWSVAPVTHYHEKRYIYLKKKKLTESKINEKSVQIKNEYDSLTTFTTVIYGLGVLWGLTKEVSRLGVTETSN